MPSASRMARSSLLTRRPLARSAAVFACVAVLGASAAGCETTQEKAAKQQARAERILAERAKRQKAKKAKRANAKHAGSKQDHKEGKK